MPVNTHVLRFAIEMFFQDSDSDEEEKSCLDKIWGFAEETVPNFNDKQFVSHFRMTPTTFENLYNRIGAHWQTRVDGKPEIALEKQLMIAIWYLANIESFR